MAVVCYIPGPDPQHCTLCGAAMTLPRLASNTSHRLRVRLWVRTCSGCHESTWTTQTPDHAQSRGPIGPMRDGSLDFAAAEYPTTPTRHASSPQPFDRRAVAADVRRRILDARQRAAGERE